MYDKIEALKHEIISLEAREKSIYENIESLTGKYVEATENHNLALQAQELLNNASKKARESAKAHLENIVTMALNTVHEEDCKFVIELDDQRGVPSAEFYVIKDVDGEISKQKPTYNGGGYVDVIATALRFAYLKAFNNPKLNNAIILDEPGSMISELASIKFAEFVKKLSVMFDKQTIMVTHADSLKLVADNTILIDKINGESRVIDNGE